MSEVQQAAAPVIKFVGGKRQLLSVLLERVPAKVDTYFEPFIGGGALFFELANQGRFRKAVIGDVNVGLVNLYTQVRDNVAGMLTHLRTHRAKHCEQYFYEQRERAFDTGPAGAARFVYLMRTCYNGLFRVNRDGEFNSPFGKYDNPRIVDADGLRAAQRALKGVKIVHGDFADVVAKAKRGDFTYFDPPYLPVSASANFTAYDSSDFGITDHERLSECVAGVVRRGARALISNSDTDDTRRIFGRSQWLVESVAARRNINSNAAKRGAVSELLVSAPRIQKGR